MYEPEKPSSSRVLVEMDEYDVADHDISLPAMNFAIKKPFVPHGCGVGVGFGVRVRSGLAVAAGVAGTHESLLEIDRSLQPITSHVSMLYPDDRVVVYDELIPRYNVNVVLELGGASSIIHRKLYR
jgi:hypothetical protein